MKEPAKQTSLQVCYPEFAKRYTAWLTAARKAFPLLNIKPSETRRTLARQQWLYASGRTRKGLVVTYTLDSFHRLGCAADTVIARKLTPWIAIWDSRVWNTIYAKVPPEKYGLERLAFEAVHLQLPEKEVTPLRKAGKLRQT
jgi:hypothetical protein